MIRPRVIPCLLLRNRGLVKTVRFRDASYVGDPVNTVRIFNEKEVDELMLLDITATPGSKAPQLDVIEEVASECFMPLAYGGGIRTVEQVQQIMRLGVEKVVINTAAHEDPQLLRRAADRVGSQAVIASIDVGKTWLGKWVVYSACGTKKTGEDPVARAREVAALGAGEILLTSITQDGTMDGYDVELIRAVTQAVSVPVIASGGAGTLAHIQSAIRQGGASAAAAGSMVVYQGKNRAVLINFPTRSELKSILS